jgi:hypothetical protein
MTLWMFLNRCSVYVHRLYNVTQNYYKRYLIHKTQVQSFTWVCRTVKTTNMTKTQTYNVTYTLLQEILYVSACKAVEFSVDVN